MKKKEKFNIRKGDQVKVIAGDQKGLRGQILSINSKKSTIILDTGKFRSKFFKSIKEKDKTEEKRIPIAIHISNVMPWDEQANNISRIAFKIVENKKQRYFKKSGNLILETSKIINNQNG